jgi:hypothetical protein
MRAILCFVSGAVETPRVVGLQLRKYRPSIGASEEAEMRLCKYEPRIKLHSIDRYDLIAA